MQELPTEGAEQGVEPGDQVSNDAALFAGATLGHPRSSRVVAGFPHLAPAGQRLSLE